jgi:hypothetical protein
MALDALLPQVLTSLFREIVDGPPGDMAFLVDPNDPGFIKSLAALPAEEASARRDGQHLRFGLTLLNKWATGDQNAFAEASFSESWSHQTVREDEWRSCARSSRSRRDSGRHNWSRRVSGMR